MLVIPITPVDSEVKVTGQAEIVMVPGELIVTVERHEVPARDEAGEKQYSLMFVKADGVGYQTHALSHEKSAELMDQWFNEYRAMHPPKFLGGGAKK